MADFDKDGLKIFQNIELKNALLALQENKQTYIDQIKLMAQFRYKKYLALIDEGFSKEEALYLTERTPLFM